MDAKPIPAARPLPVQEINVFTDTRDVLAHARRGAQKRGFQDWLICDVDAHHVETVNWHEMVRYIEDPVIRHQAMLFHQEKTGGAPYGLNGDAGLKYQDVGGRIPHQAGVREKVDDTSVHRDVTLTRRAMQSLGIDYMVLFPTPMLTLGLHPQPEMEVHLSRAYNHWLIDNVLYPDDALGSGPPPDDVFDRLNAMAESVPAGADGTMFLPWLNGERTPVDNHLIRGSWFNLNLETSRSTMVRAVFEGVALNTRWMLGAAEKFVRKQRPKGFEHINFIGGGAQSDLWCQILADVLDRPIRQMAEPRYANARGAAFAAGVALGHLRWDDIPALVQVERTFTPDRANRAVYDGHFAAFTKLYKQTKGVYAKLNAGLYGHA